ncbi:MAG: hypothetical protein KF774_17165 [Planctomyces sp.]|nr:hypothetical protein [Planctomyces sp.]
MICPANKSLNGSLSSEQRPPYEPTPAEIRAACAEIQAGWTDAERRRRSSHRSTSRMFHRMALETDRTPATESWDEARLNLLDVA